MPTEFGMPVASINTRWWNGVANGTVQVKSTEGRLAGIFVSSIGTSPSLSVFDSVAASTGTIIAPFIPVAATLYQFGADVEFNTGLYISGGTCNFTVAYF